MSWKALMSSLLNHNPKVGGSTPSPATTFTERRNSAVSESTCAGRCCHALASSRKDWEKRSGSIVRRAVRGWNSRALKIASSGCARNRIARRGTNARVAAVPPRCCPFRASAHSCAPPRRRKGGQADETRVQSECLFSAPVAGNGVSPLTSRGGGSPWWSEREPPLCLCAFWLLPIESRTNYLGHHAGLQRPTLLG